VPRDDAATFTRLVPEISHMRLRLTVVLPTVLLLSLLLPTGTPATAEVPTDTVVDAIDGLPPSDGVRAESVARVTEPIRAPISFSMLAFTAPPDATVAYRTSTDGETWGAWTQAESGEGLGPDPGTREAARAAPDDHRSGEPMWVGDAAWLQVRVDGASLDDVDVDLVDSMGLSRSLLQRAGDAVRAVWHGTTVGQPAQATGQPTLVTRSKWGADESLRSGTPVRAGRARFAVLHHTVNTNSYSRAEAAGVVRGIHAYHTRGRGWSDVGYNFLVDRFGTIYEGRAGGLTSAVIGAHALGFNTGSIGVAMIGDHDAAGVPSAARRGVTRLLAWQFAEHGIDPGGRVKVTSTCAGTCRHGKGEVVRLPTMTGHRDVGYTSCPGGSGQAMLPDLRRAIAGISVDVLSNPSVTPDRVPLARDGGLSAPLEVSVELEPPGPWKLVIRRDGGAVVHRASGRGARAEVTWSGRSDLRTGRYRYTFTGGRRTPETGTFTVAAAPYGPPFSDDEGSVHETSIRSLYNRGVTLGCTPTTFCPRRMVSRGQMVSFVARTMDHLIVARPADAEDRFVDDTGSVHAPAIDSLAAAGVVTGCGPDVFCPADDALRGDVAVWLASAFSLTPQGTDHFTDDDGDDAEWAINALADAGLTVGCTDDTYCADDPTSRAQMASFLARAIDGLEGSGLAG
jgi:hypothetical protein